MGQKSGPRVRIDTRVKPSGYGLTTRCIRHCELIWKGRCTSRNVSANAAASFEDKSVGEFTSLDITLEIDNMRSWSFTRRSSRTLL